MTVTWNKSVYTQERSILTCSNFNTNAAAVGISVTSPSSLGVGAKYLIPASRTLEADLSDLVRLASTGTAILYEMNASGGTISTSTISWSVAGLKNPARDLFRPKPTIECSTPQYGNWGRFYTMPPLKIYQTTGGNWAPIKVEIYAGANCGYRIMSAGQWGNLNTLSSNVAQTIELSPSAQKIRFYDLNASGAPGNQWVLGEIDITEKSTEKKYVTLRWTSRYGVTKVACWERRNVKTTTGDKIEISRIDNQYDTRKGYVESFTAYLDGLDAYDYWYYADIITSSSVEVIDGHRSYKVDVTTKDYTVPNTDAGKPNKLEVNINFRKYDTI